MQWVLTYNAVVGRYAPATSELCNQMAVVALVELSWSATAGSSHPVKPRLIRCGSYEDAVRVQQSRVLRACPLHRSTQNCLPHRVPDPHHRLWRLPLRLRVRAKLAPRPRPRAATRVQRLPAPADGGGGGPRERRVGLSSRTQLATGQGDRLGRVTASRRRRGGPRMRGAHAA